MRNEGAATAKMKHIKQNERQDCGAEIYFTFLIFIFSEKYCTHILPVVVTYVVARTGSKQWHAGKVKHSKAHILTNLCMKGHLFRDQCNVSKHTYSTCSSVFVHANEQPNCLPAIDFSNKAPMTKVYPTKVYPRAMQ